MDFNKEKFSFLLVFKQQNLFDITASTIKAGIWGL